MMVDVSEMEVERLSKTEALLQWQAEMPYPEGAIGGGL